MITITQALACADSLSDISDTPVLDCQVLLSHVLDCNSAYLYTWPDKVLSADETARYRASIVRRLTGEPIAFITGVRDFWTLRLKVNDSTLIPRPDTEILVDVALQCIVDCKGQTILDLGTGTGAIALALASELPHSEVTGIDISDEAVKLAVENAALNQINNTVFLQSDWFDQLPVQSRFDLIVSNPPYIDEHDPALDVMVSKFEPKTALISENGGMQDIEMIIEQSKRYLKYEGWLCFEHGFEQAAHVQHRLEKQGFASVATIDDLSGHPRVTIGQWTGIYSI